jgi:hypothetical protein
MHAIRVSWRTRAENYAENGGIDTMPSASTRAVHVPATNKETALVTDVRAARHEEPAESQRKSTDRPSPRRVP